MGRETNIVRPIYIMTTDDLHQPGDYTDLMLQIDHAIMTGYPRLHLRGVRATAYIDHRSWHLRGIDWQLWVERNGRMTSAKCPLRPRARATLAPGCCGDSGLPSTPLTTPRFRSA